MQAQFWLDKWQTQSDQKLGFHLASPHPLLKKFYPLIFNPQQGVFIPLCGMSTDITFFAEKGGYTLGSELIDIPVKLLFEKLILPQQLKYNVLQGPKSKSYCLNNLTILVGDYFDLSSKDTQECQTIYDRAALIALPETLRKTYVEHLRVLLPKAKMLLITLQYEQSEMSGPPFSVSDEELKQNFFFASITKLYSKNIIDKETKFKESGLSYLYECAYCIEW